MNAKEFNDVAFPLLFDILTKLPEEDVIALCNAMQCRPWSHYNVDDHQNRVRYFLDLLREWRTQADGYERYREGLRLLGVPR